MAAVFECYFPYGVTPGYGIKEENGVSTWRRDFWGVLKYPHFFYISPGGGPTLVI